MRCSLPAACSSMPPSRPSMPCPPSLLSQMVPLPATTLQGPQSHDTGVAHAASQCPGLELSSHCDLQHMLSQCRRLEAEQRALEGLTAAWQNLQTPLQQFMAAVQGDLEVVELPMLCLPVIADSRNRS